jgi:hypothetical protein|tara:strand:+ start:1443 stop:1733 length:291 start_codon:yes stop_codon:yes gene_type:complete
MLSDATQMENITNCEWDVQGLINQIRVVDFDGKPDNPLTSLGRFTGIISQEVVETLPQVVRGNPPSVQINLDMLVPYLWRAVQRMDARIKELEAAQ